MSEELSRNDALTDCLDAIEKDFDDELINEKEKESLKDMLNYLLENKQLSGNDLKKEFDTYRENLISKINNEGSVETVHNSGILDDEIFYQVIFLNNKGTYQPVVATSTGKKGCKGRLFPVKDNNIRLLNEGRKKNEISDEEKFFYFDYTQGKNEKAIMYKFFAEDIFFSANYKINTVDVNAIRLIEDGKSSKGVYDDCVEKLKEYFDHHNNYEYDVAVSSILNTYLLRCLNRTFYYILQGKEDTGKSTLQKTLSLLQFNGKFSGKGTVALTVRLNHFLGCAINQDEMDKLSKDDKKAFTGVLNTGLYPDGTYEMVDVNKRRLREQITILYTFGHKTFSTNRLSQFESNFLSRCYINITTRQGRNLKDINDLSTEDKRSFQQLRNELFSYCLLNWKAIKEDVLTLKKQLQDDGTFGRKTDMNSIILGLIKHFKGDYYKEVKQHLEEKEGIREQERSDSNESLTFEFIVKKFNKEKPYVEISNKDICSYIAQEQGLTDEEKKKVGYKVGWIFKNYELVRKKEHCKRGTKGETKYIIEKGILEDTLRRFKYVDLISKLQENPAIPEERLYDSTEEDLISYIKENPESNAIKIKDMFPEEFLSKAIEKGVIMEMPRGTYREI